MSLYKAILRWRETFELSFQLSNVVFTLLDTTIDYCKENNIPIYEETGIWNLAKEARHIFKLIEETNSSEFKSLKLPDPFFMTETPKSYQNPKIRDLAVVKFDNPLYC